MTGQYNSDDEDARRDEQEARDRLDRALQDARATRNPTSTRQPRLPEFQDSQDFKESQVRQDLHELPHGNCADSKPKTDSKQADYSDLFAKGEYSAIPETEFLALAWEVSEGKSWEEDGVSETWEFCRYLRAYPKYESLAAAAVVRKLRRLIDLDESYLETILAEFERVLIPRGDSPLDWAIGMAAQYPLSDPEELGLDRYNRFLSIAGWLQVLRGAEPVYLPVEKLAQILNVSPRSVSTWRAIAQRQGLLTVVSAYERRKKATEFRFAVDRFGVLRERGNL